MQGQHTQTFVQIVIGHQVKYFELHSSFSEMNLQNFAKMFTFYTKCFKLSSKCSQYIFKALSEIKNNNFKF